MTPSIFIVLIVLLALSSVYSEVEVDLKSCEKQGSCSLCHSHELQNEYCKKTGKRIMYKCQNGNVAFESCDRTGQDEQLQVIIFQVVMAIIGGLAYWGVQVRKKNTMTLFDYRKLRYVGILYFLMIVCNSHYFILLLF